MSISAQSADRHTRSTLKLEAKVVKVRAKLECACLPAGKHTMKRVSALRIKTEVWQR